VLTTVEDFAIVRDALEKKFGPAKSARLAWRPLNTVPVAAEPAKTLFELIETLEDSDDVQNVVANFEVADDVLAALSASAA
jgi:transcriptional/translational regulatory protein YebC/TACO1